MKYTKYFLLSLAIILIDQAVKMLVHFNMDMGMQGQINVIGDWFKLYYTLNPGMAFGMQLGFLGEYSKLVLTIFRLLAMVAIGVYLYKLAQKSETHPGLLWCIALILGGAIGNVIDSTFYGIWLDNAPFDAPMALFHGQVIDMFYVDIWEGRVADWVPVWGGSYLSLWPIFNIADSSIFVSVFVILFMQKKFFKEAPKLSAEELISPIDEENADA